MTSVTAVRARRRRAAQGMVPFRMAVQRFGEMIAGLIAMSIIIFALGSVVPGNLALEMTGTEGATPRRIAALRQKLGLNEPFWVHYWNWVSAAVRGKFGTSPVTGEPIGHTISTALPVSAEVAALGLLLAVIIGIAIGVFAATHRDTLLDRLLRGTTLGLLSIPSFVLGTVLVVLGAKYLPSVYESYYVPFPQSPVDNLKAVFLPSLSIAAALTGMIAQMTRTAMAESLAAPFSRAARAGGMKPWRLKYIYALRLALNPVLTLGGILFGTMIGGLIITERIFNLPGLGTVLVQSIEDRDFQVVIPATLVIVTIYMVVNFLVDVAYHVLDPRLRGG